ncbi:heat shock factor binding protein 1-domain-containing protein [Phyllosticta citrichinensis]|uniref:Heat shock factor binding protein 1-domain-containing protein n=1 Tax=Phyllosticta citrichinensis TaxID=1130410 RepID=A0ABR1XH37_9PEZI
MSDRIETTTPSSSGSESGSAELTAVVDDLLNQLSTKFQGISKELLDKMDDMSRRLDALESTIQGGGEGSKSESDNGS